MEFVVFINGMVFLFTALFMGLDALLYRETAMIFVESALIVGFLGICLSLATYASIRPMRRSHTFLLTASVWISAAVAGAVPLCLWSLSPVDALFESMSGITTTGSTVMSGLDTTPHGIILWRALLQGLGGVGFVVVGIALLPFLRVGGMQLFRTESSDKGEKELKNAAMFATATLSVYLGLIGLCTVAYFWGGMSFFDAITHAMTTLSTGGYSSYDASFGHFQSPFLQWSATVFMVLGGMPFAWFIRVLYRGTFRSEQVAGMIIGLAGVILVLAIWHSIMNGVDPLVSLREVAFNVVSVVTTTGYASTDYTLWGPFAVAIFFGLTAVGGCTGSTAGGIKALRWILLIKSLKAQIAKTYSPHMVTTTRYEGQPVEPDVINGVIAFFTMYTVTFGVMSLLLGFLGLDFITATSGALTALSNVGPGVGDVIGPAGNFSSLNDPAKLILVIGMFLGRLELMTVFVLFSRAFWREADVFR